MIYPWIKWRQCRIIWYLLYRFCSKGKCIHQLLQFLLIECPEMSRQRFEEFKVTHLPWHSIHLVYLFTYIWVMHFLKLLQVPKWIWTTTNSYYSNNYLVYISCKVYLQQQLIPSQYLPRAQLVFILIFWGRAISLIKYLNHRKSFLHQFYPQFHPVHKYQAKFGWSYFQITPC